MMFSFSFLSTMINKGLINLKCTDEQLFNREDLNDDISALSFFFRISAVTFGGVDSDPGDGQAWIADRKDISDAEFFRYA